VYKVNSGHRQLKEAVFFVKQIELNRKKIFFTDENWLRR